MVTGFEGTHRGMRPTGSIPVTPRTFKQIGGVNGKNIRDRTGRVPQRVESFLL